MVLLLYGENIMKNSSKMLSLFNPIWNTQVIIMRLNLSYDNFYTKYKNRFLKSGFVLFLIFGVLLALVCYFKIDILADIFKCLMWISLVIMSILYAIKFILSTFTSIRCFFLVSILLNRLVSFLFTEFLYSYSEYANIIATLIFSILFCGISLLTNKKVAKVSNTIIEIVLSLLSLIKVFITYGFDTYIFPKLTSTIDEVIKLKEALSTQENILISQIDLALLPLLIINGLALLICEVHSYWIDKYNEGKEITWDKSLLMEYIE